MKHFFMAYFIVVFLITFNVWAQHTYIFTPQSHIWVAGTSSLHEWNCNVGTFQGSVIVIPPDSLLQLQQVYVEIPVEEMDCKNNIMNKKMKKALKAKENPKIIFKMTRQLQSRALGDSALKVTLEGELQIAGVKRNVSIEAIGKTIQDGFRFEGKKVLRMTEFGIHPPTALFGMLKTGDVITVFFDVQIQSKRGSQ